MKAGTTLLLGLGAVGVALAFANRASAATPAGKPASDPTTGAPKQAKVLHSIKTRTSPEVLPSNIVPMNDAFAGTTVQVIRTGITSKQPSLSKEWWEIVTPGGSQGFASAVGPDGTHNMELL